MSAKFSLGQMVITPAALNKLPADDVQKALHRHAAGDWGDVGEHDQKENEFSLKEGLRLFSIYHAQDGTKFWIITEADLPDGKAGRSATTVLLPEDY